MLLLNLLSRPFGAFGSIKTPDNNKNDLSKCIKPNPEYKLADDEMYCIRSKVDLVDKNNVCTEIIGYDTDFNIIYKTRNVCSEIAKGNQMCSMPKVSMASHNETCDGQIYIKYPNGTIMTYNDA